MLLLLLSRSRSVCRPRPASHVRIAALALRHCLLTHAAPLPRVLLGVENVPLNGGGIFSSSVARKTAPKVPARAASPAKDKAARVSRRSVAAAAEAPVSAVKVAEKLADELSPRRTRRSVAHKI